MASRQPTSREPANQSAHPGSDSVTDHPHNDVPADLTQNERVVLQCLRERIGRPTSAYELKDALSDQGVRYPATVYRALEKLIAAGLVHRIETANAFVACSSVCEERQPVFAVCSDCGLTTELTSKASVTALKRAVREIDFDVEHMSVEIRGLCGACRS